ncbi:MULTISPECIES: SDR family NAD(P)-dependent oxidoreductase [unclassified Curtobacterium]|uniref:SDR family NAD(P)-dependent oxidoreductase n=1 Tax=unclassified Curtobacterium TaxID=257496 RepID=UPI0015E8A2A4|nr:MULTISPECIES: SDR family NAD(P)-dependent oxidoreductase [unclassified Curtobacterium]
MAESKQLVVVIGASGGIGAAVARQYMHEGSHVIGTHRGSGVPEGVEPFTFDITDPDGALDLFRFVASKGKPDVVVIASGMTRDAPFVRMSTPAG